MFPWREQLLGERVTMDQHARDGDEPEETPADEHLSSIGDGCGCVEIWEHLSERRAAED